MYILTLKNVFVNKQILSNRQAFMGVAILMVVAYHAVGRFGFTTYIPFFNSLLWHGYSGVDIFLFFSGLGLCFSYEKNTLPTFYWNRFTRIAPLFIVLAIFRSIFHDEVMGLWGWFCNLTSLSYYGIGGCFVDWYLSALIVLYILFPLLYRRISLLGGGIFNVCSWRNYSHGSDALAVRLFCITNTYIPFRNSLF